MFHNKTIYRETAISSGNIAITIKILSFSDLPRGWHYGSGEVISREVIFAALTIASELTKAGTLRIEAFPNVAGGVLVSGYRDDETVDVMCRPNGTYSLFHENGDKELIDEDNLSFTQVSNYVQALQWRQLNSSDWYILSTTAMNWEGLKARQLTFRRRAFSH